MNFLHQRNIPPQRQLLLPPPQTQLFLPVQQRPPLLELPLGLRNQIPTHRRHTVPIHCPCHLLRRSS